MFNPGFNVGDTVSHSDMLTAFGVGNMGGMRRSKANNCLVIISDHTKGLYDDKWYGDELHYTGMGKKGDQTLTSQNRTLYESNTNGVEVHLFEVINSGEYTYHGVVQLSGKPYQENQLDDDGKMRKVWMFPVKAISGKSTIPAPKLKAAHIKTKKKLTKLTLAELKDAAKRRSTKKPSHRRVNSDEYVRDEYIAEYTKRLANGVCELCGKNAPFIDDDGEPYLESHHIVWLSKGGADSEKNTVALCPNCHRKMHVLNDPADVKKLQAKASTH